MNDFKPLPGGSRAKRREGTEFGGGRVLRNDPGMGVIRHADAGYDIAKETAKSHNLDIDERLK